jgi:hypothetical protein
MSAMNHRPETPHRLRANIDPERRKIARKERHENSVRMTEFSW